jgi:hypothetical protein
VLSAVAALALAGCAGRSAGSTGRFPSTNQDALGGSEPAPVTTVLHPGATPPATSSPSTTTPVTGSRFGPSGYQPLWPFASLAEAQEWQHGSGGHQPWHVDADLTALAFTQGYLGFQESDRVVRHTVGASDARVAVGYESEGGRSSVSAVIHLVRFGTGGDAPWEVVGTDDAPDFTLETPRYGGTVSSSFRVGGIITGVDESIVVEVRQTSSEAFLGRSCCVAAGGEGRPWHADVSFAGAHEPVLTVVASTGGHLKSVERFAVTAVRLPR